MTTDRGSTVPWAPDARAIVEQIPSLRLIALAGSLPTPAEMQAIHQQALRLSMGGFRGIAPQAVAAFQAFLTKAVPLGVAPAPADAWDEAVALARIVVAAAEQRPLPDNRAALAALVVELRATLARAEAVLAQADASAPLTVDALIAAISDTITGLGATGYTNFTSGGPETFLSLDPYVARAREMDVTELAVVLRDVHAEQHHGDVFVEAFLGRLIDDGEWLTRARAAARLAGAMMGDAADALAWLRPYVGSAAAENVS